MYLDALAMLHSKNSDGFAASGAQKWPVFVHLRQRLPFAETTYKLAEIPRQFAVNKLQCV
ncbi:MAG TPA: hypothetical protein VLG38_04430 [Gammaproteobacteria bacterium]|nr:hypothetical protein [Gammaproteobacteria bacterium]